MEGIIAQIAPQARVIHLIHGLADFDLRSGARAIETVQFMSIGFHVCVVDPGVGTSRKPLIIHVKRGDYLIGPDNGVLLSAALLLGGVKKVVAITNTKFMILPISPVFHGRHIFAPAAAHLANGAKIEEFGPEVPYEQLVPPPYREAAVENGAIKAEVITINKFGSLNINILHKVWDKLNLQKNQHVAVTVNGKKIIMPFVETFGEVAVNKPLIFKDDYGRVEVAINMGSFAKKYTIKVGDPVHIGKL